MKKMKQLSRIALTAVMSAAIAVSSLTVFAQEITMPSPSPETTAYATAVTNQLADEGVVMLENENKDPATGASTGVKSLPLQSGASVAVFGGGQNRWTTTSFYDGLDERFIDLMEGLEEHTKISVDQTVKGWYTGRRNDNTSLPADLLAQAADDNDAAIIVIQRNVGEGAEGNAAKGSYYLSDAEVAMIDQVNAAFDKVIVIFNTACVVDMQWVKDKHIDASIWAGNPGNEGGRALADILVGDVNPSGHLVDTYAKQWTDYPSSSHWASSDGNDENGKPIVYYTDDIYVGYRYFETFGIDVTYEFGFGLSYTTFAWSDYNVKVDANGKVTATVKVTNTGDRAGKDVVQLYYSYPTDSPSMSFIDVPAIELVAYGKTELLKPGTSQVVEISFDYEDLALFNETESAYMMYAGAYQIKFGSSVKQIRGTKSIVCSATQRTQALSHYMVPQTAIDVLSGTAAESVLEDIYGNVTRRHDPSYDATNDGILVDAGDAQPIDVEAYNSTSKNHSFLQVVEGTITLDQFVDDLTLQELAVFQTGIGDITGRSPKYTIDGVQYGDITTLIGLNVTGRTAGNFGRNIFGLTMADRQETIGFYNESPWGDPNLGPAGYNVYPSNTVNASTWNQPLIKEYGIAMGRECTDAGIDVFLGVSMNIHRNPLGGRNSEYLSEDPIITGYSAAAVVEGVQSTGTVATLKHVAANNQETNRNTVNEIISERALREIYLKGYQIAVEKSNALAIMTSYNKINGCWTAQNYDLQVNIFRGEWGFEGFAMNDWGLSPTAESSIAAGNDVVTGSMSLQQFNQWWDSLKNGIVPVEVAKRSAKNILSVTLKSRHYADYENSGIEITPPSGTVYAGDDFKFTITLPKEYIGFKLINENGGGVTIKGASLLSLTDSSIWTLMTNVGTAGERSFTILARKLDGSWETLNKTLDMTISSRPVETFSAEFIDDSTTVNAPTRLVVQTSSTVKKIKVVNELNRNMGIALISKTATPDGIRWVYEMSIGSRGMARFFYVSAAGSDGIYTNSVSDYIHVF